MGLRAQAEAPAHMTCCAEGLDGKAILDALGPISGRGHKERAYNEASDLCSRRPTR